MIDASVQHAVNHCCEIVRAGLHWNVARQSAESWTRHTAMTRKCRNRRKKKGKFHQMSNKFRVILSEVEIAATSSHIFSFLFSRWQHATCNCVFRSWVWPLADPGGRGNLAILKRNVCTWLPKCFQLQGALPPWPGALP